MTAAIWPPIAPDQLLHEEEDTLAKELQWLLSSLQNTLQSLKAGLDECAALLAPDSGSSNSSNNNSSSSTLVLSSFRSEAVKGFATRVGTRIVKGDISLRLPSIPLPRGQQSYKVTINSPPPLAPPSQTSPSSTTNTNNTSSAEPPPPLILPQLVQARTHINSALDVVDAARWAGDTHNAGFIAGQFRLLQEHVSDARQALRGSPEMEEDEWWREAVDVNTFTPPLPQSIAFHLFIRDAALVLQLRTLELLAPSNNKSNDDNNATNNTTTTNHNHNNNNDNNNNNNNHSGPAAPSALTSFTSFKDQLAVALGGVGLRSSGNSTSASLSTSPSNTVQANSPTAQQHRRKKSGNGSEGGAGSDGTYTYRGQRVRVKERVRVGTQDPALMAALAKLSALEHHVAVNRNSLRIVMGGGVDRGGDGDSDEEEEEEEDDDDDDDEEDKRDDSVDGGE